MNNLMLEQIVNQKLNIYNIDDYLPNGLQVEGRSKIKKIISGVTACQILLDAAVHANADAIIVHHGYFWKNEVHTIKGIKRHRLRTLLSNDINLYSWHLPLDIHPELGNNIQLARLFNIQIKGNISPLVLWGELLKPISSEELSDNITQYLNRKPLYCSDHGPNKNKRVALCTGAGQRFIDDVADFGVDAFITGECSEQTIHIARERGLNFFAAGHHATERGGIKALGKWLSEDYKLNIEFVDVNNFA